MSASQDAHAQEIYAYQDAIQHIIEQQAIGRGVVGPAVDAIASLPHPDTARADRLRRLYEILDRQLHYATTMGGSVNRDDMLRNLAREHREAHAACVAHDDLGEDYT